MVALLILIGFAAIAFLMRWDIDELCEQTLAEEIGADVQTDAPPRAAPQRPASGTLGADTPFDWADAT